MSVSVQNMVKTLIDAVKKTESKTSAYDTPATVRRIEGDTAWVHINGGVDETPVKLTIAANVGDDVQVRVSGGRAFMVGNASAPPTDDTTAIIAQTTASVAIEDSARAKEAADNAEASAVAAQEAATQAVTDAGVAGRAASVAQTAAEAAQATADTKKTVFITQPTPPYHVGDLWAKLGDDLRDMITSGGDNLVDSAGDLFQAAILTEGTIYVCTVPKLAGQTFAESDWELATADEGLREWFWHDANGAHILGDETGYRNDITSTGMKIIDTSTEKSVAEFGSTGAQIGQDNEPRVEIQPSGIDFYADNNIPVGTIGQSEIVNRSMTVEEKFFDDDGVQEDQTLVVSLPYTPTGNQIELGIVASRIMGSHTVTSLDYSEYINYTDGATTTMRLTTPSDYGGGDFGLTITATVSTTNRTVTFVFARDSSSYYLVMCQADVTFSHYWRAPHFVFGDQTQTETAGQCSVAMNATEAAGDYQTTVGKYNIADDDNRYAFIVGKGTDVAHKSNALTVDWNGNVKSYGNITDGNGNTLSTIASATNSKLKNITVKGISKSFYIGAGTSSTPTTKDISFTSTQLDGGSIFNAYVCLGTYQLPYFNVANNRFTWVSSVTSDTITISNSATAWGSSSSPYTAYCVLFLTGTS